MVALTRFCAFRECREQTLRSPCEKVCLDHSRSLKFLQRFVQSLDIFLTAGEVRCIVGNSVYPNGHVNPVSLKASEKCACIIIWWQPSFIRKTCWVREKRPWTESRSMVFVSVEEHVEVDRVWIHVCAQSDSHHREAASDAPFQTTPDRPLR
jgi:hypothetical protein